MQQRRSPFLVAVLVVATGLIVPAPAIALPHDAALRAGMWAIAAGVPIPDAVEQRVTRAGPEVGVSLELRSAPDAADLSAIRRAGLAVRGALGTTLDGYVSPDRLRALAGAGTIRPVATTRTATRSGLRRCCMTVPPSRSADVADSTR